MRIHDDRLLVEELKEEKTSLLDIPTNPNEAVVKGRVIGTGDLVDKNRTDDIILYEKHMTIPVKIDGKNFFILRKGDVIITL